MSSLDKLKRLSTRNRDFIVSQTLRDQGPASFYQLQEGVPWVFDSAESALVHLTHDLTSLMTKKGTHCTMAEQAATFELVEHRSHKRYQIILNTERSSLKAFDEVSGTVLKEIAFPSDESASLTISQRMS